MVFFLREKGPRSRARPRARDRASTRQSSERIWISPRRKLPLIRTLAAFEVQNASYKLLSGNRAGDFSFRVNLATILDQASQALDRASARHKSKRIGISPRPNLPALKILTPFGVPNSSFKMISEHWEGEFSFTGKEATFCV